MEINGLWEKLEPQKATLQTLKKDLAEGKVPELPFFIVDQEDAKKVIGRKLSFIDDTRMTTSVIVGQYGNGKTNLLKYLQLFFQSKKNKCTLIYSRADVEQPDIVLFLLKLVQDRFTEKLMEFIVTIRDGQDSIPAFANNFIDNFAAIKEYSLKLFDPKYKSEDIKKLIYLGTGRLYTKSHFSEYGLEQLHNFNRREILVLFLNILSYSKLYIIFGIDEIEKIQEKSNIRFNQFLTSYRELVDLFNKINGHFLISCFTDAAGQTQLQSTNDAFYSRVKHDILELHNISKRDDLITLLNYLNVLFDSKKEDIEQIASVLSKRAIQSNRELLRHSVELLLEVPTSLTLKELLEREHISELYNDKANELEIEGVLSQISNRFYDPLEYYLEANFLLENPKNLDKRNNIFIDEVNYRVHIFIFNENSSYEDIDKKVKLQASKYNFDLVIYSPVKLELSNSSIKLEREKLTLEIVDYEPKELFVLLMLYKDNFEKQDLIQKVIESYTKKNL